MLYYLSSDRVWRSDLGGIVLDMRKVINACWLMVVFVCHEVILCGSESTSKSSE